MRSKFSLLLAALFMAGITCTAFSEDGSQDSTISVEDEVVVYGQKDLRVLRFEVIEAEDKIYEFFNKINLDKRFDIHCREEAPLGTRLRKRVCQPNFYHDAMSDYAQATVAEWQGFIGGPTADPLTIIELDTVTLYEKVKQAALENPEFFQVILNYNKKKKEFNDARQAYFQE